MIKHLSKENKKEILLAQLSIIELSRKLGFSTQTIYLFAKKNNILLPRGKKKSIIYNVIIGKKYGKLKVINKTIRDGRTFYLCVCVCGEEVLRTPRSLFETRTPNCGCSMKDVHKEFRKGYGEASAHIVYLGYKSNASKRNRLFKLTEEEFKIISTQNCFYCGKEPSNRAQRGNSATPFIYNIKNSVACCKECNIAKNTMSIEEFKEKITNIYKRIKIWNKK